MRSINRVSPGRQASSTVLRLAATLFICLGLLLSTSPTFADEIETDPNDDDRATSAYSRSELEVGVHYRADYGGSGDLPNSKSNAYGFYNTLRYHPYSWLGKEQWCRGSSPDCYIFGDSMAWEDDWVDNNNNYIDDVDMVFYEGHGWSGGFTLNSPDDGYVQYGEVQGAWGNNDLEWMFLLSCSVLADSHRTDWYRTMDGLHGIAGFRNTAYDVNGHGSSVAFYMMWGYKYKDAWFKTCDTKQPSGVQAQIIVEDSVFWNESAYNQYSDRSNNNHYYYWWKSCGAPAPASVTPEQLNQTFPVYQTPPLSLEAQQENTEELANAFEFSTDRSSSLVKQTVISETVFITDTTGRELEIDPDTGLFYYYDEARTFGEPSMGRNAEAVLTEEDARQIADQFLQENGLLPSDAQFNSVASVMSGDVEQGVGARATVQETTTGYQVIYNRYLTANVRSADGRSIQQVEIPVDGPGAKIKVYVDPTSSPSARVARQGQVGSVTGAMGGWRQVDNRNLRAPTQVDLLDYETQILPLFENNELEPLVSYENVPFPGADSKEIITYTIAGWEEANGESQDMIYPAYRIDAVYSGDQELEGGITETVVLTGSAWIAGNPSFMRPLARFETEPESDKYYKAGDTVTATAVDASRTLADLGYDPALDFALGSGDLYIYTWYLGDEENGKQIGESRDLSYVLTEEDISGDRGNTGALVLTLVVNDVDNSHTSQSSSSAAVTLETASPVYVPHISTD